MSKYVILLHGLHRKSRSMNKLKLMLEEEGYLVVNDDYPSTKYSINKLISFVIDDVIKKCDKECEEINFVTHSLGGIILRGYLEKNKIKKLNKVVMLGPPNYGSELVDYFGSLWIFKKIFGEAGGQLGTLEGSFPNNLIRINFNLGVIAGYKNINPFMIYLSGKPSDSIVSVSSTKVKGMSKHIALNVSHTFMMNNKLVIECVKNYLIKGSY